MNRDFTIGKKGGAVRRCRGWAGWGIVLGMRLGIAALIFTVGGFDVVLSVTGFGEGFNLFSMKKYILYLFLFLLSFELKAHGDTVIAIISHKQFARHIANEIGGISNFYLRGDTLVWGHKIYLEPRDTALIRKTEMFQRSCFEKYFKFKTRSGIPVAEGRWVIESFIGPYKEYHTNGLLKVEGQFSADTARKKNGVWRYYSKKGVLVKSINYSTINSLSYIFLNTYHQPVFFFTYRPLRETCGKTLQSRFLSGSLSLIFNTFNKTTKSIII